MEILIWSFLSYGLMNIVVFSSIFEGFRNFFLRWGENKLNPFRGMGKFIYGIISCPMCFSTWGGFFLGFLFLFLFRGVLGGVWVGWLLDYLLLLTLFWVGFCFYNEIIWKSLSWKLQKNSCKILDLIVLKISYICEYKKWWIVWWLLNTNFVVVW